MTKKKVLITGGAGFIGSALTHEMRASGGDVYIFDDLSFGNRTHVKDFPDEQFFTGDILDIDALNACFGKVKPDVVMHLAAIHFIPYCNAHPFVASNINIQGTMNILDACERIESVKQVLFASTAAVYPVMAGPISEETRPAASDIYGLSKVAGEQFCRDFANRTGIPTIVCRFFNAFGDNETNPHLIPEIQGQLQKGVRKLSLGNLSPRRDYIHTTDISKAIRLLSDVFDRSFDVFNIGSGKEYSVGEIVEAFERSIGENLEIEQDAARVRKSDRLHLLADISKLQRYIKWSPSIGIIEGIDMLMNNNVKV